MRYTPPPKELFVRNREKFVEKMKPGTAAIIFANDILVVNGDATYKFSQNSNFYYLTGIDQEDGCLFLFPSAPREDQREILFTRKTDSHIQVWEGWKYSKEEATEASGIKTVHFLSEFDRFFYHLISHFDSVYLDFNEHDRNTKYMRTPAHVFAERITAEFPGHKIERANPILLSLRQIKELQEIEIIRKAISITEKGFRRCLNFVKPGLLEYEVEAEMTHEYIRNGSTGHAYEPIVAGGERSNILHYNLNDQILKEGDLLLLDCGAEYGNYSSDLTRTIPVSGKYSTRQKEVYDGVYHVLKQARALLKPAEYCLDEYHFQVGKIMTDQLLSLGLLTKEEVSKENPEWPAYKKYFMHGTSHHMGLDTHDLGGRYTPFAAGMVFTVEPGIYIPEEGFGIRIENNIWITEKGPIDLMESIPIEASEIEELMQTGK